MALRNLDVPLYNSSGEEKDKSLTVNEFAGRLDLTVKQGSKEISVSLYFDDLLRAWNAVKRH